MACPWWCKVLQLRAWQMFWQMFWQMLRYGLLLVCVPLVAFAQEEAVPRIGMTETVFGTINDASPDARWQFDARRGDQIAVLVQAQGALDPYVQIMDEDGHVIAENDDIAYPERMDAALEGIALNQDGRYTVRVTRFGFEDGQTEGDFILTLLPVYADLLIWEPFSGEREWSASGSELVEVEMADDGLQLTANANNALVWAAPAEPIQVPLRGYVQVEASVENMPDYWEYGLIFRQSSPTNYYLFAISSRGDWAFLARAGASTWLQIQDWTEHDALSDPPTEATLGVAMVGDEFTFYVNGMELATISDDTHSEPGGVAVSVGTVEEQDVMPVIRYDNLLITEPLPAVVSVEEISAEPLSSWEASDGAAVIEELRAQEIAREGGEQVMFVPESFTTTARPGMQVLALGQGRAQADLVIGSTVVIESESAENGCGLVFRRESADHYSLFFVDGLGGYGVAEWVTDRFDPALYSDGQGSADEEGVRVVLVVQGDLVSVYLNGQPLLAQPNLSLEGGIGIAALNYDGVLTDCQFQDTWLWAWE